MILPQAKGRSYVQHKAIWLLTSALHLMINNQQATQYCRKHSSAFSTLLMTQTLTISTSEMVSRLSTWTSTPTGIGGPVDRFHRLQWKHYHKIFHSRKYVHCAYSNAVSVSRRDLTPQCLWPILAQWHKHSNASGSRAFTVLLTDCLTSGHSPRLFSFSLVPEYSPHDKPKPKSSWKVL